MSHLTIQERLIQLLQPLQLRRKHLRDLSFSLRGNDPEYRHALQAAGFIFSSLEINTTYPDRITCQGPHTRLITMVRHSFSKSWMKYYHMISMVDPYLNTQFTANERIVEITINDILRRLSNLT